MKKTYLEASELSKKRRDEIQSVIALDQRKVRLLENADKVKHDIAPLCDDLLNFLRDNGADGIKVGKKYLLYPFPAAAAPSANDILQRAKKKLGKATMKTLQEIYENCKKEKRKGGRTYLMIRKARKVDVK